MQMPTLRGGTARGAENRRYNDGRSEGESMSAQVGVADRGSSHSGVRGWLLVLCLYLMLLIPALAILGLIGAWQTAPSSPALRSALALEAVFELALAAFAFYAGLTLYRIRPKAVAVAKVYFITILTLGLLGLGIVVITSLGQRPDAVFGSALRGPVAFATIREVLFSLLWLAYLERSSRVRGTFSPG
jgi:hypothetical protein